MKAFRFPREDSRSFEDLIRDLEAVELNELATDNPANVRAELKRMKRNLSAILEFVSPPPGGWDKIDPELEGLMTEVRRACLRTNGRISTELILLRLPWSPSTLARFSNGVAKQYTAFLQAVRAMCMLAAPEMTQELLKAL